MPLNVSVGTPLAWPVRKQVEYMQWCESLGLYGVGVADHLEYGNDAFIALALAATTTSRITLMPTVANPITRHPFAVAGLANTMAQLAPGRFKLPMGSGDSTAIHTGTRPASVDRMRQVVAAIRKLLHGEAVPFGESPEERILALASPPPPVVVVASGRRMMEVAGEVGDEAMLLVGLHPAIVRMARRHLEAGAQRAARSLDGFTVTFNTVLAIDDDPRQALERVRGSIVRFISQGLYRAAVEEMGLQLPQVERPQELPDDLLPQLADAFCIAGTPDMCVQQFRRLRQEAGVTHLHCMVMGDEPVLRRTVETLARDVLPKVNG